MGVAGLTRLTTLNMTVDEQCAHPLILRVVSTEVIDCGDLSGIAIVIAETGTDIAIVGINSNSGKRGTAGATINLTVRKVIGIEFIQFLKKWELSRNNFKLI